ncbi:MAG: glycosyltransferase [Bacteroidota bacterium]
MKILFLTSRFPYPPYRGDKLKIYNLIRETSKHHEVVLLSFIQDRQEDQWKSELLKYCKRVKTVYHPTIRSIMQCAAGLFRLAPFQVSYFRSARMKRVLEEVLTIERPDVIHTHLIRMAPYTADLSLPRVLDLTDAVSLYLDRFRRSLGNPLTRWLLSVEHRRMVSFEAILEKFDRVLVCSKVDQKVLQKNAPAASIDLLWNGIDTDAFRENGSIQRDPKRIILTGNMSYFPNVDGVKFFVRSVFPLIKAQVPDATLFVVGQNPPRSVRSLARHDIVVTGFVNDLASEYLKSAVAVSPVRFGAGTLNKVLEPMALGIPVVATPISVEGLDSKEGEGYVIAETPDEFAIAVVRVISDLAFRKSLLNGVSHRIRSLYSWDVIGKLLQEVYGSTVTERKSSAYQDLGRFRARNLDVGR